MTSSAVSIEEQASSKPWIVLALVPEDVHRSPADHFATTPPRWPAPLVSRSVPETLVCEITAVPLTSISLVTRHFVKVSRSCCCPPEREVDAKLTFQVDPVGIIDKRLQVALDQPKAELFPLLRSWSTDGPEEVDWSKVRGVEFREALRSRDEEAAQLQGLLHVSQLPQFDATVSLGLTSSKGDALGRPKQAPVNVPDTRLHLQYEKLHSEYLLQDQISKSVPKMSRYKLRATLKHRAMHSCQAEAVGV